MPDGTPSTAPGSGSELWAVDAEKMHLGPSAISCRIKLPQRVPYGYVPLTLLLSLVYNTKHVLTSRLHGTWLPPSAFKTQRTLPAPLSPQPLLQDKLARSRIQHFVSIIFSRPPTRDKSLFERIVLGVLWPAAFLLLGIAVFEAHRHLSGPRIRATGVPSGELYGIEEETQGRGVSGISPMMLGMMAVGFIALGLKLRSSDQSTEVEEIDEKEE